MIRLLGFAKAAWRLRRPAKRSGSDPSLPPPEALTDLERLALRRRRELEAEKQGKPYVIIDGG